jgi:iron(III) transport system substrate-binding protein
MIKRFGRGVLNKRAALLLALGGCAPAAPAPAPTAAPAKPTSAPAAPAGTTAPAAPVAAPAAPAAKPAASPTTKPQAAAADNPAAPFVAEESAEWKAIMDAARQERELTVYGGVNLPGVVDALRGEFEAKYGFKVNVTAGTGAESRERVLAERDAGRRTASVFSAGETSSWELLQENVLEELRELPNGVKLHPFFFENIRTYQNRAWPVQATVYGLAVNAQLVPEAEQPKNWKDVLDPKWKGKIVMEDPGRSGGSSNVFDVSMRTPGYGEEFHRELKAQDPLIVRDPAEVERILVRGERAIGWPGPIEAPARNPGAPLKWIIPTDGVVILTSTVAIVKDAPAPNAARVFANWMLSPEFQTRLAQATSLLPSIQGVSHPMGLSSENLTPLGPGVIQAAGTREMQEKARTIYGR